MGQWIGRWMAAAALTVLLGACGNGGDEADPAAVTVGLDGGSVVGDGGVKVLVPPGAMAQDVTIRVAQDDTGAPPLPGWTSAAGPMVAITPHGAEFSEAVTVRLPVPAGLSLQDNQRLLIAKAQPGGEWEVLGDTVVANGQLEAQVRSFSYFAPVVVTYVPVTGVTVLPQPYAFSSMTLTCDGVPCANPELVRRIPMSVTVTPNGGLLPASCVNPRIGLWQGSVNANNQIGGLEPVGSGTVYTRSFTLALPPLVLSDRFAPIYVRLVCTDASTNALSYFTGLSDRVHLRLANYASVPTTVQFPSAVQVPAAAPIALRALFIGGSSYQHSGSYAAPTAQDQAVVYLERKVANDTVWQVLQTRTQLQANPTPLAGSLAWAVWGYDFDLGPANMADNGAQFRMRACYRLPTATAQACNIGPLATLTVVQHTAVPSFSQQPRALLVQPGQTASFSVVAGGTPAPTLQWQTRPANGTGDWVDVTDGSGAATANYTTPVLQLGDSGRQYRALAGNAAGQTPSETVTVSVSDAVSGPTITSQPVPLTVLAGSEAVFAIAATGTGPLSYQWKHDGLNVLGANGSQLKLAAVTAADAGSYVVRVTNAAGAQTSTAVTLTVTAVPEPATPVAPTLLTQPAAVAVTEGNTATFGVGVSGTGPFSFQWRRNGVALSGATAATVTLAAATTADAGNYSVVVTNGVGSVTSQAATLAVAPAQTSGTPTPEAPAINAQPGSVVVAPGMGAVLAVGTQGSGPLAYRWSRDGTPLAGQTGAHLVIAAAGAGDAGSYQVVVSNVAGSVTSAAAQLMLVGAPAISAPPVAVSATAGATATFGVTATGDALRYQWLRNGEAIPGASAASFTTPVLVLADSGAVYGVVVYNGAGLVFSQGALLTVTATANCTGPGDTGWCRISTTGSLTGVSFGSSLVGLANQMYGSGATLRTTDGGITWTTGTHLLQTYRANNYGTAFADANTVIAVGSNADNDDAVIYRSTDAGQTWNLVYSEPMANVGAWLQSPVFLDANVGLVAAGQHVLRTADGGLTWTRIAHGQAEFISKLASLGGGTVIGPALIPGSGNTSRMLRSVDGGLTWTAGSALTGWLQYLSQMSFMNASTGIARIGASSGQTYLARTTDGGVTWALSTLATMSGTFLDAAVLSSDGTGVVTTGNGEMLRTADGGVTWQAVNSGTTYPIRAGASPAPGVFVMLGDGGVLRNTEGGNGP